MHKYFRNPLVVKSMGCGFSYLHNHNEHIHKESCLFAHKMRFGVHKQAVFIPFKA